MSKTETAYEHIVLDDGGVAIIEDTTMKVIELALDTTTYGWSPEEAQYQHPYLSLGQVHSALAYYWDHQEELDADIARRLAYVDELRQANPPSPLLARLRQQGQREWQSGCIWITTFHAPLPVPCAHVILMCLLHMKMKRVQ